MRQEVSVKLQELLSERRKFGWKDGWIYGRLKKQFILTPDELNAIAKALGFKYGWNSTVENILEEQWRKEEIHWMNYEKRKLEEEVDRLQSKIDVEAKIKQLVYEYNKMKSLDREMTDIERGLVVLIMKMKPQDQLWLLEMIYNRFK